MTNAIYVVWFIPLLGAGLISGATCIKLFVLWCRSRRSCGFWGDGFTCIQCIMSLGLTASSFFWWWAITYAGGTQFPWAYSWRQLVSRSCTVIPTFIWGAYVFDVLGRRSRPLQGGD